MSRIEIIVCERTSRWASALRMELASGELPHRLRELRHLAVLDAELDERPTALVAIEVRRGNFAELLAWLAAARTRHGRARFAALLDHSLAYYQGEVGDALVEAGIQAIVASPRRLEGVVAFGERHAAAAAKTDQNTSLVSQVWAALPWQAGPSQVG
jgi:hypothetical protein